MLGRERRVGELIAPWVAPGATLLDVGGGSGRVSAWLAERTGARPTITEVRPRAKVPAVPVLLQRDPLLLPVETGSFDVALLLHVLHHLPGAEDQEQLLAEAMRAATRVIVMEDCPRTRFESAVAKTLDWGFNRPRGIPTPFTFRTTTRWTRAFHDAGLSLVDRREHRAWWPALKLFPSAMFVLERRDA